MHKSGSRPVSPLRGAAPYQGGKRNLAGRIVPMIEATPHDCYAEVFLGMGGIFFRRRTAPRLEVVNDRSRDVATFFRVLQRHYLPFVEMLRWQLTTRAEFERLVATNVDTLTDLERAARFYYLQRTGFGGKIAGRTFGVSPTTAARFDVTRLVPQLEELHTRLSGVVIECVDFGRFLEAYDRPETLFYLDPPYVGGERDYGPDLFHPDDFARLAERLRSLRGAFILSLNDVPLVRELFADFPMEAVRTTYSVTSRGSTAARELLIRSPGVSG